MIRFRNGARVKIVLAVIVSILSIWGTVWGATRAAVEGMAEDKAQEVVGQQLEALTADGPQGFVRRYELSSANDVTNERLEAIQRQLDRIEERLQR